MTAMNFYGPFHFNDIEPITGKIIENIANIPEPNQPGVYIWGFMYYYNSYGLVTPVNHRNLSAKYNSNTMQFIPYYVGKHEFNIYSRIKQHYDIRNINKNSDSDKYIRFSHSYMSNFFKDPLLPIKVGNNSLDKKMIDIIKSNPSSITYYNSATVLNQIYPSLKVSSFGSNQPITIQKINDVCIPDTLEDLVDYMNNFWFCFAPKNKNTSILEEIETTFYYSLKGKTISKTQSISKVETTLEIKDYSNTKIFKKNNNQIVANDNFSGY